MYECLRVQWQNKHHAYLWVIVNTFIPSASSKH